ncbi:hypothetical protein [Helicobacter pylori]|uniref:hypothetical protein n=1 Tax=Helicobacter pylori TaxID=210 RepID=UPI003C6BE1B2
MPVPHAIMSLPLAFLGSEKYSLVAFIASVWWVCGFFLSHKGSSSSVFVGSNFS